MTKKEEFVKKFGLDDIIHCDIDESWQWIEEYDKQARIDELRKVEATIEVATDKKIGVFLPLLEAIENRIKELNK